MSELCVKKFLESYFSADELAEKMEKISAYVAHLLKWNKAINVIARKDEADVWERHILDAVQLVQYLPYRDASLVATDIGSGGGLPGILVAILCPFELQMIESDSRKCIFLKEVLRKLGLDHVAVVNERIENADVKSADVLMARGLTALPGLLDYSQALLKPSGMCLFPKGRKHSEELKAARLAYHFDCKTHPSITAEESCVLEIKDVVGV